MTLARSKVTTQGQISVPVEIRRNLGIAPGSVLEWVEDDNKIVVRRAGAFNSQDIHRVLFGTRTPKTRSVDEMKNGAWVSVLALAEATWVLTTVYELSSKDLATAIEMLLDHRDLVLQESEVVTTALELFRARPSLGFSDCLMLQLARKAGHLPL